MSVPVESGSSSEQVTSDCHQMSLTGDMAWGVPCLMFRGLGMGGSHVWGAGPGGGSHVYGTWARGMGPVQ